MKRKRFYKHVKRNQTWTEEAQGRKIDFADKYAENGTYSNESGYLVPGQKPKFKKKNPKDRAKTLLKAAAAVIISILITGVGYTAMDVYMIRHRMPDFEAAESNRQNNPLSQVSLNLKSEYIDAVSLDGADMLAAVISAAGEYSFSSVAFDIKRAEGTIGYRSALANAQTYGTVAFSAAKFRESVEMLNQANIFPVGIIWCYSDNVVPAADPSLAVLNDDGSLYKDSDGNTYLNPDSEDVYRYIKGIIEEVYAQGVTAFVLRATELPEEISGRYEDGFNALADRLYSDLGTDIKFIHAVDVQLSEDAAKEKNNEISEKISDDLNDDSVYFITAAADKYLIKEKLEEGGILSFILADR